MSGFFDVEDATGEHVDVHAGSKLDSTTYNVYIVAQDDAALDDRTRRLNADGTAVFESRVAAVGPKVELLPERLWSAPTMPAYGLALHVPIEGAERFRPGQVLGMRFLPQ